MIGQWTCPGVSSHDGCWKDILYVKETLIHRNVCTNVIFINTYQCIQLFLTICVSVASCGRIFSNLKLITNYYLRSAIRFSYLAILSTEVSYQKH